MYKISTLNKISSKGLGLLTDKYEITDATTKADAILVRSQDMHEFNFSKNLRAIARAGAGVNNIPIEKCSENGIVVFNTPGANANAVKELVLAGLLLSARNVISAAEWAKTLDSDIAAQVEKQKSKFAGEELYGKRLAVVGLGYIGVIVANAAKNLGMNVVGYDPYISVQNAHDLSPSVKIYDSLPALLPHCDYVSIHVPANKETTGMFNYEILDAMKNKAVLLNFSRDSLVVAKDVKRALKEKKLHAYVTDFPIDELIGIDGVTLIPHLGASTKEAEENCAIMAVKQTMDYLENGIIVNSINFPEATPGVKTTASRICVLNKNIPAMLGKLTGALAEMNVNIAKLINKSKGDLAYTVIDTDQKVNAKKLTDALDIKGIISVRVL